MQFEYYVLNYNYNKKCVEHFNIFRNILVQERTEKEIKKYLKAPSKYAYSKSPNDILYGFEALCAEIKSIIMWQEWGRREYEISVSDAFVTEIRDIVKNIDKFNSLEELKNEIVKENSHNPILEKWDCYEQALPNIECITRECIYQYKQYIKNN